MLKALYDYGIRNALALPPGFVKKNIRAYICLSESGRLLCIELCSKDETQICPDIGSLANGPDKCNPLREKTSVILGEPGAAKPEYFRKLLRDGSECAESLLMCLNALEDEEIFAQICSEAQRLKLKPTDYISFRVNDVPITKDEKAKQWWTGYRRTLTGGTNGSTVRCLITGQPTTPLATLPGIDGLQTVGGKQQVRLFCFDKAAFRSYGLEQSANAPVSEEAFAVVKGAMDDLLAGAPAMYDRDKNREFNPTAPVYSGMKFVHWYDFSLAPEDDPILQSIMNGDDFDEDEDDLSPEELEEECRRYLQMKQECADKTVNAVFSGEAPKKLSGEYHIMLISGNVSRAMIRRYEHGNYETLRKNLQKWMNDLRLQDNFGTGIVRPQKLYTRLIRLVKFQSSGQNLSEQMKKELAGVTPAIIMAIINGTPLPDTVAVRALAYIRSKLLSAGEDEKKSYMPDAVACQWLKVWLIRKRRMRNEEEMLMEYYDSAFPNAAYHCGAWLAVYANLQHAAMGDVNATLVRRFYASASQTPALVFGTLERMGEVYLDMLRNKKRGLCEIYEDKLNEVCAFFGTEPGRQLPKTLDLEDQSCFALGYRQMCTQIKGEIKQRSAEKEKRQEEN